MSMVSIPTEILKTNLLVGINAFFLGLIFVIHLFIATKYTNKKQNTKFNTVFLLLKIRCFFVSRMLKHFTDSRKKLNLYGI